MVTKYPAQIDTTVTLPSATDNFTPITGSTANILRDAILAVENTLGVQPAGAYGTVVNRISVLETDVNNIQAIALAGDLGNILADPFVIGIQGRPVSSSAPSLDYVLTWNGIAWAPAPVPGFGGAVAGGDLSGTYPSPTVAKLQGNAIKSGTLGSAQNGYVLTWVNSASQWQALTLPPSTPSGPAGGDLAGTYPNPIVNTLTGTAGLVKLVGSTTPSLQSQSTATSLTVGTNKAAATLILQAGAAATQATISTSSVTLNSLAGNGAGVVGVNNSGILSFTTAVTDIGQSMSQVRLQYWSGNAEPVAGPAVAGMNCLLVIGSSNIGQVQSTTNLLESCTRGYAYYTGAGSNFLGSFDAAGQTGSYPLSYVIRGNAAGIGGFTLTTRFGIDQISTSPTLYCFVGLQDRTASGGFPQTDFDFTTQTTYQVVGCGFTQTVSGGVFTGNWQIISCNGSATTVTDSGVPLVAGNLIELQLVAAPSASSITWTLKDISAATSGTGSITTHLPLVATQLAWLAGMQVHSGGGTANVFSTVRYTMESNN